MATEEAINKLKDSWMEDPCWDIETTEGFEDHVDELQQFRFENEARWDKERQEREELEKNKTFQERFDEMQKKIERKKDHLRHIEFDDSFAHSIQLMQVEATLLLAKQVNVVVDLLAPLTKPMMFLANKDDDRDGLAESVRIWGSGS